MDYVPHKPIMTYTELEVSQLMWIISLMRLQLPMLTTIDSPGDSLIQRVLKHSKSAQIELTENFFTAVHNICFTQSFCHGDFSLDNILSNDGKVTLIDPIYDESLYSSYVMDISKLLHSLRRKGYHSLTISTYQRLDSWFPELNGAQSLIFALELVQWIRVINYLPYETEKRRFKQFIQEALDGPLNYTAQYH
jgi:tRNA A-37 threonylcarbamoyl transferase component Bud32